MIKGLRGASIWSEDVKNLLPFYRDVLGLKVGFESPGFVVLGEPRARQSDRERGCRLARERGDAGVDEPEVVEDGSAVPRNHIKTQERRSSSGHGTDRARHHRTMKSRTLILQVRSGPVGATMLVSLIFDAVVFEELPKRPCPPCPGTSRRRSFRYSPESY